MRRPVRTLLFSTLYPSSARPGHGIFVETRLRELLKIDGVECKVVAPVPWFFSSAERWGKYARMAATPPVERRHGIDVLHPRYVQLPKVGMSLTPLFLALASIGPLHRLRAEGYDFDVIDAHYFYPDGVAAALLARWFHRPLAITARGSDLNFISRFLLPRRMMQWAARHAGASIGVCTALVEVLRGWQIDNGRLHMLRNGVDLELFHPLPRLEALRALGIGRGPLLLSVGNLVESKGHHLVIEAFARIAERHSEARLAIVGDGPERARLADAVQRLQLGERVSLTGRVAQHELTTWYSAASALVLASSREGWANVLLEAMACGTPVVATRVGGTAEVVGDSAVGVLVDERTSAALADAVLRLLASAPPQAQVRAYAEGFDWNSTSRAQFDLFRTLCSGVCDA